MDKASWFRLPEREHTNYKLASEYRSNVKVAHARTIVRCGYYVSPSDMPGDLAVEKANALVGTWLHSKRDDTWVDGKHITLDWDRPNSIFSLALWNVKKIWGNEEKRRLFGQGQDLNLRTFWYIDHPERYSWINRRKTRKIGTYYAPSYGWYYDEYDSSPGGIDLWSTSVLAEIDPPDFMELSNFRLHYYIHPLDILEITASYPS